MTALLPERLVSTRVIAKDHPINHTTIVRADNVLDYVNEVKEDHSLLTNIAPPLPNLFIQFHISQMVDKELFEFDMGIHIESERVRDREKGIEWELTASLWTEPNTHRFADHKPLIWWIVEVSPDGKMKDVTWVKNNDWWDLHGEKAYDVYRPLIAGALFAINLMNCKNVILEEQPLTKRDQRMTKHGKPAFRYHLLKVKRASKLYDVANTSTSHDEYSTHICRGHFKTFTDDAPLLGRFVGTYWWDAHVRGRDKDHVVDKDYEVAQ